MIKDKIQGNTTKLQNNNAKLLAIKNAFITPLPSYSGGSGRSIEPTPQSKTVTPTTSQQTVTADTGYILSSVTVNKIPESYIIPTGSVAISENGVYNISDKESVTVNVPTPEPQTEEKTVDLDLSTGNQVVNPSAEKLLSKVTINKPSTLIPENIAKDIVICGVTGTHEGGSSEPTMVFDSSTGTLTITEV